MTYSVAQPPFTLKFKEMTSDEIAGFYQWFLHSVAERITQLAAVISSSSGFENWKPDQTPASLDQLGHWFLAHVETRARTIQEMNELRFASEMDIEIPAWDLTNRTFSLAMDIGMYLSKVIMTQHPKLRWEQPLDDLNFVDYGRPVIAGFGVTKLNPVRVAITIAYSFAAKEHAGDRLRKVYEVWSNRAAKAGN